MHREIFGAVIALLAFNGTALAQSSTGQTTATQGTCALPKIADTVAMNPIPGSDLMAVPVKINATAEQFLLNLSTNPTEVSQATVDKLSLPDVRRIGQPFQVGSYASSFGYQYKNMGQSNIQASVFDTKGSASRWAARRWVSIGSFALGQARGHDLQFVIANDREMEKAKSYDGLLTNSFFRKYDVELDFAGKKIFYYTATKCTDPNKVVLWPHAATAVVPMDLYDGALHVPVTIGGHTIVATIDTTSEHTVMRRGYADQNFDFKPDTPEMMPYGDLEDGMGQQVYVHTFPKIAFEGVVANNVPTLIQTNSMVLASHLQVSLASRAQFKNEPRIPDLTIGMDVLRQLHLYVVFGQKIIYITAAK